MPDVAGSYIVGENGELLPNLNDEAMAERERVKNQPQSDGEEVRKNG